MENVLDIYIGFDRNEIVSYHVLCQSILEKSSRPVRFTPLNLRNLAGCFSRDRNALQSTEFSFSRFLVPYLANYSGWSLFLDCDMLAMSDFSELFDLADPTKAVMVCKHDYQPKEDSKFLGQVQTKYEKKNWSSAMLFNNEKCRALTPEYVNTASGLELHQFKWLKDDTLIGELPLEWNWLVGEYPKKDDVKNVHYTIGGPYFDDYKDCDYAEEWNEARQRLTSCAQKSN
jgi:hypothetical protein